MIIKGGISRNVLFAGLVLGGLHISSNIQAATVYAASINKITNFSMSFSGGSGSFSHFTFSNSAAANDSGTAGVTQLDAPASCIGCSYDNEFLVHSSSSDFAYGDALIISDQVISPDTGAASSIAEAQVSSGSAYATGSNTLNTFGFHIDSDGTIVNFGFDATPYMEASAVNGGNAFASMSISMNLTSSSGSIWSWTPGALNIAALADGSYNPLLTQMSFASSTGSLNAGDYTLSISMAQTVNVSAVPIPAALPLMFSGLLGIFGIMRRRKK